MKKPSKKARANGSTPILLALLAGSATVESLATQTSQGRKTVGLWLNRLRADGFVALGFGEHPATVWHLTDQGRQVAAALTITPLRRSPARP